MALPEPPHSRADVRRAIIALAVLLACPPASADEFAAPVRPFNAEEFARAKAAGRVVLVETYAKWCLACRIRDPLLKSASAREPLKSAIQFRMTEATPDADWRVLRLRSYGMLVLYSGGREVARGSPTTEAALTRFLDQAALPAWRN